MTAGEQYIAFQTILIREMLRFLRIWIQTLLPPMVTTALYFVIFGQLIGAQLGAVQGLRYIDFIVPGVIIMTVISNSFANVVSSFYSAKFQHHIEEMMVAPVPNYVILLGFVGGGIARGVAVGVVVTVVASFFVELRIEHPLIVLSTLLFTAMLFSLGGLINGVFANSFDDISIIPTFVLSPLTYLGGVFYSVSMLPPLWQQLSHLNPMLYMVSAFRYGMFGVADIGLVTCYAVMAGFIVVLFCFGLYLLHRGHGIRS